MNRERRLAAWAIAGVAVAGLAFFAGRELRPHRGEASAFDLEAPAYEAAKAAAGFSKAGFTGFGETGPEGRTVVSGRIVAVAPDSITIESVGGQRSTVRLTGQASLRRLEAADRDAVRAGVTVLVRRAEGADTADAVLIVAEP